MSLKIKRLRECMGRANHVLSEEQIQDLMDKYSPAFGKLDTDELYELTKDWSLERIKALCTSSKDIAQKCRVGSMKTLVKELREWHNVSKLIVDEYTRDPEGFMDLEISDAAIFWEETIVKIMDHVSYKVSENYVRAMSKIIPRKDLVKMFKIEFKNMDNSVLNVMDDSALIVLLGSNKEYNMLDDYNEQYELHVLRHLDRKDRLESLNLWKRYLAEKDTVSRESHEESSEEDSDDDSDDSESYSDYIDRLKRETRAKQSKNS